MEPEAMRVRRAGTRRNEDNEESWSLNSISGRRLKVLE